MQKRILCVALFGFTLMIEPLTLSADTGKSDAKRKTEEEVVQCLYGYEIKDSDPLDYCFNIPPSQDEGAGLSPMVAFYIHEHSGPQTHWLKMSVPRGIPLDISGPRIAFDFYQLELTLPENKESDVVVQIVTTRRSGELIKQLRITVRNMNQSHIPEVRAKQEITYSKYVEGFALASLANKNLSYSIRGIAGELILDIDLPKEVIVEGYRVVLQDKTYGNNGIKMRIGFPTSNRPSDTKK